MPGMSSRPATMTSRRRRNSSTIASTGPHGPSRAAIAAYWLNADVQDTVLIASRVTGSTRAGGKHANAGPPAGHRERLGPAVQQDRPVRHAVEVQHRGMRLVAVPDGPVHLVAEHGQVVPLGDLRYRRAVLAGERAAARVVRGVEDEQPGPWRYERLQ